MNDMKGKFLKFTNEQLEKCIKKHDSLEEKRIEFIKKYPLDKIMDIGIDDYVVGKINNGNETFCYLLETKLIDLGNIKGSFADKFGIYYSKNEQKYKTSKKWDKEQNIDIAFYNIKSEIYELLIAGENFDLDVIAKNKISPMFKNKILVTYYPEKFINIFSDKHVNHFIKELNIKEYSQKIDYKRQSLIKYKENNEYMKNLNNFIFSSFLYYWNPPKKDSIVSIKILPMSSKIEFPNMTYEQVQDEFFMKELYYREKCKYFYKEKGMSFNGRTLVLFQFDGKIIASAELIEVEKFDELLDGKYRGSFCFECETIKIFQPILAEEFEIIDENFKGFSQSKKVIDITKLSDVISLIESKEITKMPEEINTITAEKLFEGSKKTIVVNAYERNNKARNECIKKHGTICAICGFDFAEIYGEVFKGKIHVHHIVPLNEIDSEYQVKPEKDLVPVCPNCHLVLHAKNSGTYTIEEVKKFIENAKL